MKFGNSFLRRYLDEAPAALAVERSVECEIHAGNVWQRPILDIGCGDGIFAKILFAERIDTGIDPDASEVSRAREVSAYDELIVCFGDKIPKPDGSYRTIFSNSVMEHIPDILPVLREAHRLLAPDGVLYLTLPTNRLEQATVPARLLNILGLHRLAKSYGGFYNRFWRHYHAHSEHEWGQIFSQAGFQISEERTYIPRNLSTFCDAITPLALPSMIARKFVRRWFFSPAWRRLASGTLHAGIAPIVERLGRGSGGGLAFYALRK